MKNLIFSNKINRFLFKNEICLKSLTTFLTLKKLFPDLSENPEEEYKGYMRKEFVGGLVERVVREGVGDDEVYSILKILAEIAKTGLKIFRDVKSKYIL